MAEGSQDSARSDGRLSDETVAATDGGASFAGDFVRLRKLEHGTRIGRYTLLEFIGAGGMGVVYEAYDPELDRRVALKLLAARPGASSPSSARGELLGEAKTLARLSSPNVVAVYDAGHVEEGPAAKTVYLAMELVEGKTLRRWIDDRRELGTADWDALVAVFIQAGQGLAAAHVAGVVHRDFKPQNVLVSGGGRRQRVRVADFGLAVLEPTAAGSGSAQESGEHFPRNAGTPAYMAPEQIAGAEVGPAADQFAFCVALFEALFGLHPFKRDTIIEQADAVLHADPEIPVGAPRVPAWLRKAVLQGLSRDAKARHPSMDALVAVLSRDRWQWLRRGLLLAAGITVVAGLGSAVAAYLEPGQLRVTVTDESGLVLPDASVEVDGQLLIAGAGTHQGSIRAGTYALRARAPNHVVRTSAVDVDRGGNVSVEVTLAHEKATLDLDVEPRGATVLVDGVDRGSKLVDLQLDTGRHDIVVRKIGHYERHMSVMLGVGERVSRFVSLPVAVRSASRATGPTHELAWAGDATGDGRPEVYSRTFGTMELRDPWQDRALWSLRTPDTVAMVYRFADVDGDGASDVIRAVAGDYGGLSVFSARQDPKKVAPRWSERWDTKQSHPPAAICTVDVDGDGKLDLVTSLPGEHAVIARRGLDGEELWRRPAREIVGALERLGDDALVTITANGIESVSASGEARWTLPFATPLTDHLDSLLKHSQHRRGVPATMATADLDLDEHVDVLVTVQFGDAAPELWAVSGRDGTLLWKRPTAKGFKNFSSRTLDITGDGSPELLVRSPDAQTPEILVLDGTSGAVRVRMPGAQAMFLEGYAEPRIVTVLKGTVRAFDGAGTKLGESAGHPALRIGTPFDHDGDGKMEAAFEDGSPGLRMFDGNGEDVAFAPTFSRTTMMVSRGDVDGDGFPDLLARAGGVTLVQAEQTLWQREAREGLRVSPVGVDGNDDGRSEVAVFGNFGDGRRLNIFDAANGRRLAVGETTHVIRTPVSAQFRGSAVLMSQDESGAFVINSARDATEIETLRVPMGYASPAIGDANRDGRADALLVPWAPNTVQLVDLESMAPIWSYQAEVGSWMQPLGVDVDGAAPNEVVIGRHDGVVEVRNGATGEQRWSRELGPYKHNFAPAFANTADGPTLFVNVPDRDNAMVALDAVDGSTRWRTPGPSHSNGNVVADIDRDGRFEVFAGTARGLMSIDESGEVRWTYETSTPAFGNYTAASGRVMLEDLNHDGHLEVFASFNDGSVRVLDAETGEVRVSVSGSGQRVENAPTPVDVDNDGVDELFIAGQDHWLRCLKLPLAALAHD